jgi:putative ABC transport system substrate-binding protein
LATIFGFPAAAKDGALIAYGPDYLQMNRRAPFYVNQILKGTKPADLPVELPTKISLLVNVKTAKTLGVEVPLQFLIRPDVIIEYRPIYFTACVAFWPGLDAFRLLV